MKLLLFQGDSITDAVRDRVNLYNMGSGYATMTAGKIALNYPGKYSFANRGVASDRVVDLYARIKKDVLNLKPDILTILIGFNDAWHDLDGEDNGVDVKKFEMVLELTIKEVLSSLPETKILLLEPYVLPHSAMQEHFDKLFPEVLLRSAACKRVAEKYGLPFVPLLNKLEALAAQTSVDYVVADGVHPTCAGHALISEQLYAALEEIL